MRIGVDLDDTICSTTEIVQEYLDRYSEEYGINDLDIMNNEELKSNFFNIYMQDIYTNVIVKKNCSSVLKRLKEKGHELYIITGRTRYFETTSHNVFQITEDWLHKNGIEVDAIITSAFKETKADVCLKYHIDLMIDDDPLNYKCIVALGKKCLLFDDKARFVLKQDYVTDWLEVEKEIEKLENPL